MKSSIKKIKTKLKKDDNVVIVTGNDNGKRGKILLIDKNRGRVVVEGINKRKKYVKQQDNPKGALIHIELPINISNVMYFCEKCKNGVRLGVELKDKNKIRVCKNCGKSID